MWSVARESTIQPLQSSWLETSKAELLLPLSMRLVVNSFGDSTCDIRDSWGSAFAKAARLDLLAMIC